MTDDNRRLRRIADEIKKKKPCADVNADIK